MEKLSSQISALRTTPLGRACARSFRALNRRTVACVRVALTLFMVGYLANPTGLRADSLTWDAAAVNALWSDIANWGGAGSVPGTALGETATFNNTSGFTTIDLGGGVTILNINFASAAAVSYTLGIAGVDTLTLENGGSINLASDVVNSQIIDAAVVLGQDASASTYTLDNDASGISLTINGGITGGTGGGPGAKTLAVTGTDGIVVLNGIIADGGATSLAITKSGTGSLTLAGANIFTGGVTLDLGTLVIDNATALGTGTFDINGGTLDSSVGATLGAIAQTWDGDFAFTGTADLNLGTGAVTLGGNRTVTVNGGNLTVGGIIDDGASTFSLGKAGAGTLILNGVNTYGGDTFINGGVLTAGDASALSTGDITFGGGALRYTAASAATDWSTRFQNSAGAVHLDTDGNSVTLASDIDSSNTGGLTKNGAGTLTISGPNTFLGGVTVLAGTLASGAAGVIPDASPVIVANGTLALAGFSETIGALTLGGSPGTASVTMGAGTLTLGGNVTYDATGGPGAGTITGILNLGGATRTFAVGDSGGLVDLTTGVITGTGGVIVTGPGVLTMTGVNTFTGNMTISGGGVVELTGTQSTNAFGSRDITLQSGGAYRLGAGASANFNPNGNTTEFIIGAGGGTIEAASGNVTLDDLPLFNVTSDPAGPVYVAGTGQLSGSGTLTKTGTGTLSIRGQPFFTGLVNVTGGGLTAQDATALGSGITLGTGTTLTPNTFSTAVPLTLAGDATIAAGVNSPAFTGNVDLGAGAPRQLNVTGTAQQGVTFGQIQPGSTEFNKAGAGYLSLAADNSASGLTQIRALGGMLGLNNANALPATANLELQSSTTNPVVGLSASVPAFNLTLGVNPGEVQFTAGPGTGGGAGFAAIDGTRTVNLNGGGAVTWNAGSFVPDGRSLVLGNTLASGTVDFQNQINLGGGNRTNQVENGSARVDAILSGGFTDAGAFTLSKTGQGALYLPNANATPGLARFNINGGTVLIGNANAFGTGVLLTNTSGNLSSFDGTAYTIANPFTLAGNVSYGQLSGGTGALTFSGNYSGTGVRIITNFANVTFSGVNSGTLGISKTGPGTLTLSGPAGVTPNAASGANTVSQGILNLDYTGNDTTKIIGALNLGGGTLQLTGGTHVEDVTSTILQIGASTVTQTGGSAVLNMNALTNARVTGGTLDISGLGVARTDSFNLSNNIGSNGIIAGYVTLGRTNWAVSASTGVPGADIAITGLATIHTNFVTSGQFTNLVVGATHTVAGTLTASSLRFTNTGAVNLTLAAGGATLTSGGILDSANTGGIVTITGGTLTAGAGVPDLVIHQNSASEMRINSRITGTNALTKTGTGTLALTNLAGAFNDYTGPTYINGGTIRITNDSNLGTAPAAGPAAQAARLVFNGGALQVTADTTTFTNRGMTLLAGGGTFNVTGTGVVYSNQAAITGPGNLTKIGNGTLSLNAVPVASSYTGRTIILDGNLVIAGGSDNRLGTAPGTYTPDHLTIDGAGAYLGIPANTTLSANRGITLGAAGGGFNVTANTLTVPGVITGSGALRVNGGGAVTLQGVNTYTGGTTVSNTALRVNNDLALGSGALTVRFGGTFASSDYNARTIANALIINTNAVLSDTTGHGALNFTGGISLPSINASIINVAGFGGVTFSSVLSGGAVGHQVSKTGVGTLNLTAANTLAGTALISAGRLAVSGAAGSIQSITAIAVSGTNALLQIGATTDATLGVDRILNTAGINLTNYGGIVMNGSSAAGITAETVGTLNIGGLGGGTILSVTLNPASGQQTELLSTSLSRSAGSTVLFRGTGLGSSGANSSRLLFTTAPGLTGGGGASGNNNISILPYAMVDTTATGLGGTGFVTYDPTVGVRLLTGAEYDTVLTGTVDRNVSLNSGTTTLSANQGINAIRLNGGNLTIDPGITLTNNSGAFLFSAAGTIGGGSLSLASAEGIIHIGGASGIAATINSAISGAYGLTISGNDAGDTLTIGGANTFTGPITLNRGQVILGSATALGGTDAGQFNAVRMNNFSSSLNLNGQSAMIGTLDGGAGMVIDNSSASPLTLTVDTLAGSSVFQSPITQTGGGAVSLVKNGVNTLNLQGNSPITGSVTVNQGQLTLDGNGQRFDNISALSLGQGATLLLNYANGNTAGNDRVNDAAPVTMAGSTLLFTHNANSGTSFAETLGALTLDSGGSVITTTTAASGRTSALTVASLTRNSGATLNFGNGSTGIDGRNRFVITAAPTLDDGIIGGWATVAGTNFAKYPNGATISVAPLVLADYTTVDQTLWAATHNIRTNFGTTTLTGSRNINSLNLFQTTASAIIDLGTFTLNVESGGVLASRDFNSSIINGTLTAGGTPNAAVDELFLHTYSSTNNPLEVSAVIANNVGDTVNVVKAGTGTLVLSGANTFTGSLTHNGGVLRVAPTALTALNANANAIVLNGGILASSDATARQFTGPVTLQGSVILGDGIVGTGPIDLNGAMNVSSGRRTITVDVNPASGEHVLSGAITGPGQIFKAGLGSLTLTGNYGTGTPLMVGAGTFIVKGALGEISSGVIVRPGATLTLDNALNNVNRLTGGTLVLGTSTGNTTTFNYLIDSATAGTTWAQSVGALVINGTAGTVRINTLAANVDTIGLGGSTSTLTFASLTKDPGSILDFYGDNIGTTINGGLYTNRILITGQAAGPIPGATVSSLLEGTDDAGYDLTLGVIRLAIFDTSYTPESHPTGTPPNSVGTPASWLLGTTKANPAGGVRLDPNQSIVLNQLRLNTNAVLTTPGYNGVDLNNGLLRLSTGTLRASGDSNQWVYGGALTAGATAGAAGTLAVDVSTGITLKVDAVVTNNSGGTVSLTKQNSGTLELNAVNTYTGKSAVNGGTLAILTDSGLGAVPGVATADAVTLNGGTLRLGNDVTIAANRGITLGVNHGTMEVLTGNVATNGSFIAGVGRNLTKTGDGSLTLNRANTFNGAMILNGGTLVATANAGALGAGTLTLTSGNMVLRDDVARAFNRNTTVNGNTTISTDRLTAGAGLVHTLGTLSIGAQTLTVNNVEGLINAGTQGVTFGAVTLTGTPTFDVVGSTNALTLGAIGGGFGIIKTGTGVITNTGAGTFTGATEIRDGSFVVNGGNNRLPVGTTVTLGNLTTSGKLVLGAADVNRSQELADLETSGTGTDNRVVGGNTANSTLTLRLAAGSHTYDGFLGGPGVNENQLALTKTGLGNLTLNQVNTYVGNTVIDSGTLLLGAPGATGTGPLFVRLATNITYTSGVLDLNGNNATAAGITLGSTATDVHNVGQTPSIINSGGAATLTLNSNLTYNIGNPGFEIGQATISADLVLGGARTRTFTISNSLPAIDVDITGDISGAGSGITKAAAGTLQLSGNNTFDNGFTLSAGQVNIGSANALGTGSFTNAGGTIDNSFGGALVMTPNNPIALNGTLNFIGSDSLDFGTGAITMGASRTITAQASTLTFGGGLSSTAASGTQTLTVNGAGNTVMNGAIVNGGSGGTVALTKAGTGILTLGSSGNTFTGAKVIEGGTLRLGAADVIPDTGTVTVRQATGGASSVGTLDLNGFSDTIAALTLGSTATDASNAGQTPSVVNTGAAATLTLGGDVTYNAGTATFENGTATISANIDLGAANRTFTVDNSPAVLVDLSVSGTIAGAVDLIKAGAGTLALTGNNTFSGAATINASGGVLGLGADGALGAVNSVNINGGTLAISGSGAVNRVNNSAPVSLGGGAIALVDSGAVGLTETLGALTLTATSIIDFGATDFASSILTFADSSANTWTGNLDIHNWSGPFVPMVGGSAGGVDQIHFASSGLTGPQLGQVRFWSDGGTTFLGFGQFSGTEVVPTPEPATWASLGALGLLLGWRERRRLLNLVRSNAPRA